MSFIQNLFTSRDNNSNSATYVGQQDRLWWDPVTNRFYYSDGVTPGGFPVGGGGNTVTNKLVNGAYELVLDATGNVTAPGAISAVGNVTANYFVGNGSQLTGINVSTNKIFNGNSYANIATANGNVEISVNAQPWTFDSVGALNLPANGVVRNTTVNMVGDNFVQMQWVDSGNLNIPDPNGTGGVTHWAYVDAYGFHVETNYNAPGGSNFWNFGLDGNITLPGNTSSINYANGTPYGGGGGYLPPQTGNVGKILSTDGTNPLWATQPGVFGLVIDGGDAAYASADFIVDGGGATT